MSESKYYTPCHKCEKPADTVADMSNIDTQLLIPVCLPCSQAFQASLFMHYNCPNCRKQMEHIIDTTTLAVLHECTNCELFVLRSHDLDQMTHDQINFAAVKDLVQ